MFYQSIYLFIAAFVLAYLEVQIEGQHGWAAKLPTWRPDQGRWFAKLWHLFVQGKDLTGYHFAVDTFVFLLFHYPFFAGAVWSWPVEAWTLSAFFLFFAVWDYLWIIINPHYGVIKRRPREDVWWHKYWLGPFPSDYYVGILLSIASISPLWWQDWPVLKEWGIMFGVFIVGTILVLIITELVRGDIQR